jgi:5,10-methylenetetrahydromethanopterin reductase
VHAGHQLELSDADKVLYPEAAASIPQATLVGDAAQIRDQVAAWEASGITEVAFQPAGPDIPGELERFAAAVRGSA